MKPSARLVVVVLALAGCLPLQHARSAEPVDAFLEALRARKYYDESIDYLERLAANTSIPEDVRQRVPYEQAVTLLSSAADHDDPQIRETRLARAAELFNNFCAANPQHALAASARNQLAGIVVERARGELLAAGTPPEKAAAESARKLLEQARAQFDAVEKELNAQLAALPKLIAPDNREQQALKRQVSSDLAQARLWRASIDYELAKSHDPNSKDAKKHFADAAKSYAALHDTYRTRAVGLLARLW